MGDPLWEREHNQLWKLELQPKASRVRERWPFDVRHDMRAEPAMFTNLFNEPLLLFVEPRRVSVESCTHSTRYCCLKKAQVTQCQTDRRPATDDVLLCSQAAENENLGSLAHGSTVGSGRVVNASAFGSDEPLPDSCSAAKHKGDPVPLEPPSRGVSKHYAPSPVFVQQRR
jgi:hypothetical protein